MKERCEITPKNWNSINILFIYRVLADFSIRVSKLTLSEWDIDYDSSKVVFRKIINPYD